MRVFYNFYSNSKINLIISMIILCGIISVVIFCSKNIFKKNNNYNVYAHNLKNNINICCVCGQSVDIKGCCQDKIYKLNFDNIFPKSPICKIFDSCIKIYQELNVVCKKIKTGDLGEFIEKENAEFFTDLLVGKLFDIKVCLLKVNNLQIKNDSSQNICQRNNYFYEKNNSACEKDNGSTIFIHEQDIEYLNKILDEILLKYSMSFILIPGFEKGEKSANVCQIINEIKGVLGQFSKTLEGFFS